MCQVQAAPGIPGSSYGIPSTRHRESYLAYGSPGPGNCYQVPGQVPGARYLVPGRGTKFQAPYQVQGTWYQAPGTWYQAGYDVPGTRYRYQVLEYLVAGARHLVQVFGTRCLVPSTRYRNLGLGTILGIWYLVPGSCTGHSWRLVPGTRTATPASCRTRALETLAETCGKVW